MGLIAQGPLFATSGGAATSPSFIGDRRFSCTTAGVGDCDDAVVPIGGEQQGRLSWIELQPQIELQQMND